VRPNVHDDVEDRSGRAAYQLVLFVRRVLIVQAPQRALTCIERHAALTPFDAQSFGRKFLGAKASGKEAAIVGQRLEVHEKGARQR
jgi:hypothetical protein